METFIQEGLPSTAVAVGSEGRQRGADSVTVQPGDTNRLAIEQKEFHVKTCHAGTGGSKRTKAGTEEL